MTNIEFTVGTEYIHRNLEGNCDLCGAPFPYDLWLVGFYIGIGDGNHRFLLSTPFLCHGCLKIVRLVAIPVPNSLNVSAEFRKLEKK